MPVVFVHGVATRSTKRYEAFCRAREALLRSILLPCLTSRPDVVRVFEPYWGGDAATFAWNGASLPSSNIERFRPTDDSDVDIMFGESAPASGLAHDQILLAITRESLELAVDLLWAVATGSHANDDLSGLANFAARAAAYAAANPSPSWLPSVPNDAALLGALLREVYTDAASPVERFGSTPIVGQLREAVDRMNSAPSRAASLALIAATRSTLHRHAATVIGDIVGYLAQRKKFGESGPIAQVIASDIERAMLARTDDDPSVMIIAHSMGGNIVYDLLSNLRTDLACEVLVTVGSQPGLFAELGLFPTVTPPVDPSVDRVRALPNVGRWLNVFDPADVLAFAAEPVFAGVSDYNYSTGQNALRAHSTYLIRPSFYTHLAKRIGPTVRQ